MTKELHFTQSEFFDNAWHMAASLREDSPEDDPITIWEIAKEFTLEGFITMAERMGAKFVSIGGIRITTH